MTGSDRTSAPDFARTALAEPWNRLTVAGLASSAANTNPRKRPFCGTVPSARHGTATCRAN